MTMLLCQSLLMSNMVFRVPIAGGDVVVAGGCAAQLASVMTSATTSVMTGVTGTPAKGRRRKFLSSLVLTLTPFAACTRRQTKLTF